MSHLVLVQAPYATTLYRRHVSPRCFLLWNMYSVLLNQNNLDQEKQTITIRTALLQEPFSIPLVHFPKGPPNLAPLGRWRIAGHNLLTGAYAVPKLGSGRLPRFLLICCSVRLLLVLETRIMPRKSSCPSISFCADDAVEAIERDINDESIYL